MVNEDPHGGFGVQIPGVGDGLPSGKSVSTPTQVPVLYCEGKAVASPRGLRPSCPWAGPTLLTALRPWGCPNCSGVEAALPPGFQLPSSHPGSVDISKH